MNMKLLGYYNYTVVLTYIGMCVGFTGICFAINDGIIDAVICLMLAGVCDAFDGTIASTRQRNTNEKTFGIQIDSLSDLVCFGVLPAVILCCNNTANSLVFIVATIYVLCALIRLAYFNVDEQNRQVQSNSRRDCYYGLPVTSISLILPVVFIICQGGNIQLTPILTLTLLITCLMFLLPFTVNKPGKWGKSVIVIAGIVELVLLIMGMGGGF